MNERLEDYTISELRWNQDGKFEVTLSPVHKSKYVLTVSSRASIDAVFEMMRSNEPMNFVIDGRSVTCGPRTIACDVLCCDAPVHDARIEKYDQGLHTDEVSSNGTTGK